jgi:signal transduction histidine kinase
MNDSDLGIAIFTTTAFVLLLLATIVIIVFIANKKHVAAQLEKERELRTMQQELEEELLLTISRELHDNIGQFLSAVNMKLEKEKRLKPDMVPILESVGQPLNEAINQVRMLSRSLNNEQLERDGLLNSIDREVNRLKQLVSLHIDWQHDTKEPKLDKNQRLMAFRIFQEVMNNIFKHAGANKINIGLTGEGGFKMTVTDDGMGFDSEQILADGKGLGLRNIIKRAELAAMNYTIDTKPGEGCIFKLEKGYE